MLIIPIVIHLFNFRRYKRVPFLPNVRFLPGVKRRNDQNKQTQASARTFTTRLLLSLLLSLLFLLNPSFRWGFNRLKIFLIR
ncbi:MAG: hypothetical protein IPJ26_19465 [Bacteroidetes bacterium]|nr:hypothetical protein [Bacteroidota bacterium]